MQAFVSRVALLLLACSPVAFACSSADTETLGGGENGGAAPGAADPSGGAPPSSAIDKADAAVADGAAPSDASKADAGGARSYSTNPADFGIGGPSKCAGANVLFCEDFETGGIRSLWEVVGNPVVASGKPARGSKALHITAQSNGASFLRQKVSFPMAKNSYFGRLFVNFINAPKPPSGYAHWNIVGASGPKVFSEVNVGGQFYNDLNKFGVGTYTADDPQGTGDWLFWDEDPPGNPKQVPENAWACIEWMHKGETNETRFWWDGVEHPSMYTSAKKHGGNQANDFILPPFDDIWIGWWQTHQTGKSYELWIDEIVLDKERVGCVL